MIYGAWGLRKAAGRRFHGHSHTHYDHVHDAQRVTAWSLFLLYAADACVAVVPIVMAAAPLGSAPAAAVAIGQLRLRWLDLWGDAVAGGFLAALGLALAGLGC